jgi:hypothetical protein
MYTARWQDICLGSCHVIPQEYKVLVPGTVEIESCNYESVSTDSVDPQKGSVHTHLSGHGKLSNLCILIVDKSLFILKYISGTLNQKLQNTQ